MSVAKLVLSDQQVGDYHQHGFVIVREFFARDQIGKIVSECDRILADDRICSSRNLRAQCRLTSDGREVVDRLDPISDLSKPIWDICHCERLQQAASELVSTPMKRFKDKLIWKNPGANGYQLHQDYTFWCELGPSPDQLLTIAVAIDDACQENGAVMFYPGLHDRHRLAEKTPQNIFSSGSGVLERYMLEDRSPVVAKLNRGDVVIFSSLTPHESPCNKSQRSRRQIMVSMCAAKFGEVHTKYYELFQGYLKSDRSAAVDNYFL